MAELDPRQQAAVDTGPTDVFIAAGAGSGKTRVLSTRFVNAVLGHGPYTASEPKQLLAVTFTEKAAAELAERIRGTLLAEGQTASAREMGEAWISTIHGMCSRILRRHALEIGLSARFSVLDDVEGPALEAEALEGALEECMRADEGFVQLLDAFRLDAVTDAARRARAVVRSLGLTLVDVETVGPAQVRQTLTEAATALRALAQGFSCDRPLKTVEGNRDAVAALALTLEEALAEGELDGEAVLSAAGACRLRRLASVEGHDETVGECGAWIELVRQAAAQLLVTDHEQSFLAFTTIFDARYAALKRAREALDFEDLQLETARLLETRPDIAERYRRQFAMVMLDEFQDTNALQMRIIEQIAHDNLCTVGDENQSIYSFRHADVDIFRARAAESSCAQPLDFNYRTAPELLECVNGLFSHPALLGPGFMRLRAPEVARPDDAWPEPARCSVRFLDNGTFEGADPHRAEAERVAERVVELLSHEVPVGDIVVLMRALSGGRAAEVERALMERGIPVHIASGGSFFDRPEVAEARALLASISNVRDDSAMSVVLAGGLTRLGADSLVTLREHANRLAEEQGLRASDVCLWEAAGDPGLQLPPDDHAALTRTMAAIERARQLRGTRGLADSILEPLLELDADLVLLSAGRRGLRAWSNLLKLARMAGEYEKGTGGDVGGFLGYLQLREQHAVNEQEATLDGEQGAVRVMSIHAAKGLEFPAVIVAGLGGGRDAAQISVGRVDGRPVLGMRLPQPAGPVATLGSARVSERAKASAEAEAVRLLYVACTRAEESLTIIGRTDPAKDASGALPDLIRSALGRGAAGAPLEGEVVYGNGTVAVQLMPAVAELETDVVSLTSGEDPEPPLDDDACVFAPSRAEAVGAAQALPPRVSYSGLATYQRCGLRYHLTSTVRLPASPTAQTGEALAFGSAVHAVLESCVEPGEAWRTKVVAAAASAGLDDAGAERLTAAVASYLASPVAAEVFASERVMREAPIAVSLGGTTLIGAIDLIAWDGDRALIVDYKTGTAPLSAEEATARYRLQGECYALAAFRAGAARVRVVFAELERGRETAYDYDQTHMPDVARDVEAIIADMARGEYGPRDAYDPELCETCPGLGGMCAISRPDRGVAG